MSTFVDKPKKSFPRLEVYLEDLSFLKETSRNGNSSFKPSFVKRFFLPLRGVLGESRSFEDIVRFLRNKVNFKSNHYLSEKMVSAILESSNDGSFDVVKFPDDHCLVRTKTSNGMTFFKVSSLKEAEKVVTSINNVCSLSYQVLDLSDDGKAIWREEKVGGISLKKTPEGIIRFYKGNSVIAECYDKETESSILRVVKELGLV